MTVSPARRILAGLGLLLAGSGSALAADAQAFANRLKDVAAANSIPLEFQGAEAAGDNVVLKGVSVGKGDDAARFGDVTFETVTGSDAEGWKVARVPFRDVDTTEKGKHLAVSGMAIEGLQLPQKEGTSKLPGESPYFFDSVTLGSLKVTDDGKDLFSLGASTFVNTVDTSDKINSQFSLGDFILKFPENDEAAKTLREIGYDQFNGNGSMEMSWDPKTGDTSVEPFQLTIENAGDLAVSYAIGGYTPAFARSLAAIRQQMAADPKAAQSSGMAIIGLLSQLSVGSLEIGFSDASLAGKLLDYYSKKNGESREQLVSTLNQMVTQTLAGLNNPAFQTEVATAVDKFLKDPQSLTIAVNPTQPIPATQILGAAMGAPQTLPNVLQLQVTANDQTTDEPEDGDGAGTAQ
ncbi:membrane protein [Aureimonas endophytica]|uniref:Membrane protein n=1 Tax=Aureimonas endophytica TaxID=2027858 RepID=A0A916ZBY8_9HYPH|nr:hypothetical protein [Aureimonas endophytica]GGD85937.1 membrane protein [Aureimonas endophytica]